MIRRWKYSHLIFLFLGLLAGSAVSGQDVQFVANAPGVVKVGEQFRLNYVINATPSSFQAPDIKDFYVISGPNQSRSSSYQIINGKSTSSVTITYSYYLQATTAGKYSIPAARSVVDKKEYSSNVVNIEVIGAQSQSQPQSRTQQRATTPSQSGQPATSAESGDKPKDIYVRVLTSKRSPYQGESVIVTIKLYTRLQVTGFGESEMPDFSGCWTQDIESPGQINLQRENVNGVIYNTGVIRKLILFPQRSGKIEISPFKLETYIRQQLSRSRSPFDDFFGPSYTNKLIPLVSDPVILNVKALPGNKPEGFTGAVGNLKLSAVMDKTEALTNDAVSFKVTITGNGNVQLVDNPRINFPPDFEVYDPKVQTNVKNTDAGQSGSKTFEYLVIPRHAGSFRIPPLKLSYFDPVKQQYRQLASPEFNLVVSKGAEQETVGVISGRTKEDLKIIGSDILFIKDEPFTLRPIGKGIFGSLWFYLVYLGSALLFSGILIIRRNFIRRRQNTELVKNRRASKEAGKRLKKAASCLKSNDPEGFYQAVLKALYGYLSDKLSISLSGLSKDSARAELVKYKVPEEIIAELLDIADISEMASYAGLTGNSQMDQVYSRSMKLISKLEQKLR